MLKRIFFLTILIAAIVFAGTAFAQVPAPPAHGAYPTGWGLNPNNWNSYTGSYNSGLALYDPTGVLGGLGWHVFPGGAPIVYAPITLELWIEMYMMQTYWNTQYQWHRLGDAAETITFTIDGTVSSNEGLWVLCTKASGVDGNLLKFQGNIGVGDNNNMRDIPISWRGRWGMTHTIGTNIMMPWTALTWSGDELILDELDACDTWFQFEGEFDLLYHEADGYYSLELTGCPAPSL